ncbi:mRNA turnover protein 4 like protein, partial [Dufourea novaeangliae]
VSLTKTSKKGLVLKQQIVEDVRNTVEKYARIFLVSVHNMRNNKLKDLRAEWKDSRFFFGKNKVISLALGNTPDKEIAEGLHKLAEALRGQCGLLFTNRTQKEACKLLDKSLATFKLTPLGVYSKKHGYKQLVSREDTEKTIEEEMEVEETQGIDST